ncbi:unnamed protein product [Acanthosepion pharaonis]|uniref:Uncharacterized protein n=1 Tax=Acanthosepion pharaonis TaxID=158019 RepID=A0A812AP32_ACAPH|nr:unnamed protein product [Sepia pharaonis]
MQFPLLKYILSLILLLFYPASHFHGLINCNDFFPGSSALSVSFPSPSVWYVFFLGHSDPPIFIPNSLLFLHFLPDSSVPPVIFPKCLHFPHSFTQALYFFQPFSCSNHSSICEVSIKPINLTQLSCSTTSSSFPEGKYLSHVQSHSMFPLETKNISLFTKSIPPS